ncbi:DUF2917 domain-containing protein [Aquincola tertiaricarbonis]|uniref:DUF2917 domain-containing protein n=1 Tax=Aquincola tertiaricarbonis TaxID=391953 RepID=UPI0035BF1150
MPSSLVVVEPGRPVRLVCPADVTVTCVAGIAWITTARDTRDVVLAQGDRHLAAHRARLFINGMPGCVLRVERQRPAPGMVRCATRSAR